MKLRGLVTLGAALLLVAVALWLFPRGRGPDPAVVAEKQTTERSAPAAPVPVPTPAPRAITGPADPARETVPAIVPVKPAIMPPAASPGSSSPASSPPPGPLVDDTAAVAIQLDQVSFMLRDYRTITGDNPIGTNAEIMEAVMGGNPKGARLGPPEGQYLNPQGELVDRWGTPYFFHQLSATNMEIRSAGADKVLWTIDDVVR
jgi:hypothetical protein